MNINRNRIACLTLCLLVITTSMLAGKKTFKKPHPFENIPFDVLCCKIGSFLSIQDLGRLSLLAENVKAGIDKHLVERWKKYTDANKEKVNADLTQAARYGFLELVKFLITDKTTKDKITSNPH